MFSQALLFLSVIYHILNKICTIYDKQITFLILFLSHELLLIEMSNERLECSRMFRITTLWNQNYFLATQLAIHSILNYKWKGLNCYRDKLEKRSVVKLMKSVVPTEIYRYSTWRRRCGVLSMFHMWNSTSGKKNTKYVCSLLAVRKQNIKSLIRRFPCDYCFAVTIYKTQLRHNF